MKIEASNIFIIRRALKNIKYPIMHQQTPLYTNCNKTGYLKTDIYSQVKLATPKKKT